MTINLTLLGQLIAFGLFTAICVRWVWPPLQAVLEERKQRVAQGMKDAAEAREERKRASQEAAEELGQARTQSAEMTENARRRADAIVEEARREAEVLLESGRERAGQETERQLAAARDALRAEMGTLAVSAAGKALGDTLGATERDKVLKQVAKGV